MGFSISRRAQENTAQLLFMKTADSVLTTGDPLTEKLLSEKSRSSTWRSLTHRILINAKVYLE